jgi:hypothetical protein
VSWSPVTKTKFVAFSMAVVLVGLAELTPPVGWIPILDGANLLFHEAGHPFFGMFGEAPGLYGGTLGQLVFPLVIAVSFFLRGATMSFAVGSLWFFQNFFNIARYAADARAQVLPLVGGGEHDWWNILLRWRALHHDTTVAGVIVSIGLAGIVITWAWVGWRWYRDSLSADEEAA